MGDEATAVVRLPFEQAVTALRANKSRAIFFIGLWAGDYSHRRIKVRIGAELGICELLTVFAQLSKGSVFTTHSSQKSRTLNTDI